MGEADRTLKYIEKALSLWERHPEKRLEKRVMALKRAYLLLKRWKDLRAESEEERYLKLRAFVDVCKRIGVYGGESGA